MNSLLVAALLAGLTVSGGAGLDVESKAQPVEAGGSWEDVRKHFSALRSEVSTLEAQYQESLERHRRDAERYHAQIEFERRGR